MLHIYPTVGSLNGRLGLESPDFRIPELADDAHRKRYPLAFKVNAVRYSPNRIKGAQGHGVAVGISKASRILNIPD